MAKVMELYGDMLFIVKGQNPACGTVCLLHWVSGLAPPEKQLGLSVQVSCMYRDIKYSSTLGQM